MEVFSRVGDCFYRLSRNGCSVYAHIYQAEVSCTSDIDYPRVVHIPLGYLKYPDIYDGETLSYLIFKQFKEVQNGKTPSNFSS